MPSDAALNAPAGGEPPAVAVRHDWTAAEVRGLHDLPLLDLVYRAQTVHRATAIPSRFSSRHIFLAP